MKNKIVHILGDSPILVKFIDFMNDNFSNNHEFISNANNCKYLDSNKTINLRIKKISEFIQLLIYLNKADKIILHGLFDWKIIIILFFQPWLLKKCYWIMWGGDLYYHKIKKTTWKTKVYSFFRKQVIKKIGHFITYIKGDYKLAQKWYGSSGEYHECFMYPSNLYKKYDIKQKEHTTINIQLGNSADPSNNHIDVLNKLIKYKDEDIKIFAPLSYGDQAYAQDVIKKGKELFGDKFVALTEFMPFEKYLEFLGDIDIAIFAHKRQQAMGNTITLLGLGKKVYMRSDITPWQLFDSLDVKVYDVANVEIDLMDENIKKENQEKIKEYFSKENLNKQLGNIFNEK